MAEKKDRRRYLYSVGAGTAFAQFLAIGTLTPIDLILGASAAMHVIALCLLGAVFAVETLMGEDISDFALNNGIVGILAAGFGTVFFALHIHTILGFVAAIGVSYGSWLAQSPRSIESKPSMTDTNAPDGIQS